MASSIRSIVEAFIMKLQGEVKQNTFSVPFNMVPPDDYYEVRTTPSVFVVGPKISENLSKRFLQKEYTRHYDGTQNPVENSTIEKIWPRYYHLDFEFILAAEDSGSLLDLQQELLYFFVVNQTLAISADESYYITMLPMENRTLRPNLSNVKQTTLYYRIEDIQIQPVTEIEGHIVIDREFKMKDKAGTKSLEDKIFPPPPEMATDIIDD